MTTNWRDLSYLQKGTSRQRNACLTLRDLGIFETLKLYDPVLCGTIPLAIDSETSDLDIICEVDDLDNFEHSLKASFGHQHEFKTWKRTAGIGPGIVARFYYQDFHIEVFGEPQPVEQQHAYRHMVIEARLLALGGEDTFNSIRQLKANGLKTEPAFAHYFNLAGDPYPALLELGNFRDDELGKRLALMV